MGARISGVMVVYNEEHQLRFSLGSLLPWCDEVVVVDQGSDDGTAELARSMGAQVVTAPWAGSADPGRPIGVAAATGDWIMVIDADEVVHPRLARHLRELVDTGRTTDFVMIPRLNVELGHWMRYGSSWPSRKPRFFQRSKMTFRAKLHEPFKPVKGAVGADLPARPDMAIWHFSYRDVTKLVDTVNRYSAIEAEEAAARGEPPVTRPVELFIDASRYLWRQYIRGGGYRDGMAGLIVGLTRTWYRFLVAAKRWDMSLRADRVAANDRLRTRLLAGFATHDAAASVEPSAIVDASPAASD